MKIAIIGPGALGTLLAASLTIKTDLKTHLDLWLLDHNPERAKYLDDQGLTLEKRRSAVSV